MKTNILQGTKENLHWRVDELLDSVRYTNSELKTWKKKFNSAEFLLTSQKNLLQEQLSLIESKICSVIETLNEIESEINDVELSRESLGKLLARYKEQYLIFRSILSTKASLFTNINWQSPAIKSSSNLRYGVEKEEIKADWNDYKRDRSGDTFACENMLLKNIFNDYRNLDPVLNVYNSGMGAFTSLLYFLINESLINEKVFASNQIYVESKMLLKKFFTDKLFIFDHNSIPNLVEDIVREKPSVLFLEPLTNTNNLRLFDIPHLLDKLSSVYKDEIYILLDVTCILGYENIYEWEKLPSNIKIILHGSILKSPQLGLERTNSGFSLAVGLGNLAEKILDYRTLSGTNIQDYAANLIPYTTKDHIKKRMSYIAYNAKYLSIISSNLDAESKVIDEVVYPGLKEHPDNDLARKYEFTGTFFNIKFHKKYNIDKYFEVFTNIVINEAQSNNVDITHGASFGFNETSIYYSVGWDEPENHYIRISTGIESAYEVEQIGIVLKLAFVKFLSKLDSI